MLLKNRTHSGPYALKTGAAAARRLHVLHDIYSPAGRRVLLQAGLKEGMRVADFGCGVGVVTRMLAEMVGPSGSVAGIDCSEGLTNTSLPRNCFDLVYCRFLLLHLPDPASCLREMRDVLRPGG